MPYLGTDNQESHFRVRVGRPQPHSSDGYYCPLEVEGLFPGIKPIFGTGPVDSLMNAMGVVKLYFQHKNGLSKEPLPRFE